ncbi:DUF4474 domain-containing protein [Desulfoluna spongiiphila]|uniref:DUF4474 domain-containing protein n=1 Tax=Desulfoluna spongiiphila TaxID=419481 RepID=UPI0012523AC5|nr:DUF4474 domain-containing protein [Desulfoluna spongiiphila]VVS94511.1 domain of unknown function duf4474 [Desulfoluna spongiiphila]
MKRFRLMCLFAVFVLLVPGISSAKNSECTYKLVAGTVYAAGFEYNDDQDIYMTRHHALQRKFGYNNIYDKCAAPLGMVIDVEPVRFEYDGRRYMVELWKGQYFSAIGAEIGFYVGTRLNIAGEDHYRCADTEEELDIAFTMKNRGLPEYSVSGRHWWLTGFKPGVFARPDQLTLEDIEITFHSEGMAEAFSEALYRLGYSDAGDQVWCEGKTVGFVFSTPRNPQPWDQDKLDIVLAANEIRVAGLINFKEAFGLENFSPESLAEALSRDFWTGILLYNQIKKIFSD